MNNLSRAAVIAVLFGFFAPRASAEARFSGYMKNLYQYSHGTLDDRPYFLDTARARLTFDGNAGPATAHADFDNQLAAGSFFRTRDFKAYGYSPPKPWLSMEHTVSTGVTNGYGIGAYRAYVGLEGDRGVVRAGRQRIAWGTGKIWNPTDVLNPYSPTSVERDERRGVDALYARAGVGTLGQVEYVWAGEDRWVDHQMLVRGRGNFGGWDVSLLGGKIAGSTAAFMVGGDFAGTVQDGTLHGEWGYFHPQWRTPYWKAGIGYDYNVPSETRLRWLKDAAFVVEYYRAGNGQTDTKRYNFAPVLLGKEVSVARDYFGASFSKDLHPLVKLDLYGVANADDGSTFFAPGLTWNALDDLYLTAGLQRFGGERRTEYGRQPNQTVLTAQYYF
ncbi:MAG: hypothetical protein KGJ84_14750 [Elusimicrobia bacterium]|nr:hypothetical protein [Elusimicrobiota bacterium]